MSLPSSSAGRSLVLMALLVLALSACGRRGRLEAPPDPIAVAAEQQRQAERDRLKAQKGKQGAASEGPLRAGQAEDDDDDEEATGPVIAPTPAPRTKTPRRGYTVPKEPFILDPLL
jgi:predicted small lipoprotein YifL